MATDTRTFSNTLSDDATFRTWGSSVAASLQAAALTKTSDTGQIDWTTVTRPTTANTFGGYEIYKFTTDTKLADLGCYIKLEYGVGSATTRAALAVTVGTGTDGAGTLTGQVTTRTAFTPADSPFGSTPTYCSGGDGRVAAIFNTSAGGSTAGGNFLLVVERTRNSEGSLTADGIMVFASGGTSGSNYSSLFAYITSSTVTELANNRIGSFLQDRTGNYLDSFTLSTVHAVNRNQLINPFVGIVLYYHSDLVRLQPISVSLYGTARNYLPIGRYTISSNHFGNVSLGHHNTGIALLWE